MKPEYKEELEDFYKNVLRRGGMANETIEEYMKEIQDDVEKVYARTEKELKQDERDVLSNIEEYEMSRERVRMDYAILTLCNLFKENMVEGK